MVGVPSGAGEDEVEGWRRVRRGVRVAVGAAVGCSRGAVVSEADAMVWVFVDCREMSVVRS